MTAVNVICRNLNDDRVIPRFARYLRDYLGWTLTATPTPDASAIYLSGYFEHTQLGGGWPSVPVAAYFTHRETEPPNNAKAALFDKMAKRVNLRIATAPMYAEYLQSFGDTVLIPAPVERDKFCIAERATQMTAGFSGYTYANGGYADRDSYTCGYANAVRQCARTSKRNAANRARNGRYSAGNRSAVDCTAVHKQVFK
jgi:hypothetical protein